MTTALILLALLANLALTLHTLRHSEHTRRMLKSKAPRAHTHDWVEITGKPTAYPTDKGFF